MNEMDIFNSVNHTDSVAFPGAAAPVDHRGVQTN